MSVAAAVPPDLSRWLQRTGPHLLGVAAFLGAALVFLLEPMIAKLILPELGGAAAVWNTAMVFFQAALLAGYAYAHLLQRVASLRRQAVIHMTVLVLAAIVLPLRVSRLLGPPPTEASPIPWLIGVLALSVGPPFAVLSTTAPLLQAWAARIHAQADGTRSPYALYAASNLGSFAALLAYPVLIEPTLRLGTQTALWTAGYGLFGLIFAALAYGLASPGSSSNAPPLQPPPSRAAEPSNESAARWRERGLWLLLAAAPSSLMLGVTTYLTTDVGSAPFLWVAPLALYLLTFVIAFADRPSGRGRVGLLLQAAGLAIVVGVQPFADGPWPLLCLLHLGVFFLTALVCHKALAARRPPPARLTEFYLWLALGGVLGGGFNALIAPLIFPVVWEYPLVLVLAVLARPGVATPRRREGPGFAIVAACLAIALLCLAPALLLAWLKADRARAWQVSWDQATQFGRSALAFAAFAAFAILRNRPHLFCAALGGISLTAHAVAGRYDWVATERGFFGVLRMAVFDDPTQGKVYTLQHGTTLHGAQATAPAWRCHPMMYYAPTTPIGQAVKAVQAYKADAQLGVVGLGTGALAAYVRPGDGLTYFEIDPKVERFALDPKRFSYIGACAKGPVDVVLGDARLSLRREPAGRFDLLIVDAFSSDSIPTHLLTEEAMAADLRAVKPDGLVVLHLSNRNLDLTGPASAGARAIGAASLWQVYGENPNAPLLSEASTEVLVLARTPQALDALRADPRWSAPPPTRVRPWTDDYVNLIGALWRHLTAEVTPAEAPPSPPPGRPGPPRGR